MTEFRQVRGDGTRIRPGLMALGVAGMVGAPMIGLALFLSKFGLIKSEGQADGALSAIYMGGFVCIATALRFARITGRGRTGALISFIQIVGLLLAATWSVLTTVAFPGIPKTVWVVTDMAWPLSHLFMLAVGMAAWKAKVWNGWPVVTLLLCGAALPIGMAARLVFGDWGMIITFAALTTISLAFTGRTILRDAAAAPAHSPQL